MITVDKSFQYLVIVVVRNMWNALHLEAVLLMHSFSGYSILSFASLGR